MFEAMKHGLWRGQSLCLAVRKLSFRKMKNKEWRVKNRLLQFLTSLSSLFPDKFLSGFFTSIPFAFQIKKMPKAWKNTGRRWSAKHGTPAKHTSINGTPKGWQILCRVAREGNAVVVWLYVLLQEKKCRRHWTMVASHTEKPLGFSNQRSLFAKRGKVNGWIERHPHPEPCCR